MNMTKEELQQTIEDCGHIEIYCLNRYIGAKVEYGEDNFVTKIRKAEWLDSIEKLKYYLDLAIKSKLFENETKIKS